MNALNRCETIKCVWDFWYPSYSFLNYLQVCEN